jgi:sulfate transport system permease protein
MNRLIVVSNRLPFALDSTGEDLWTVTPAAGGLVSAVEPVLRDLDQEVEEGAALLGAGRWQIIWHVILPPLLPATLTGFTLAFARALGEYGSVIFIAGNLPNVSEIAPLLIVIRLSEFRYADATAIAVVMLVASFLIIFAVNRIQRWAQTRIPAH